MKSIRATIALLATVSGCYAAYPLGKKRAQRPVASPGARLEIKPTDHVAWMDCGNDVSNCVAHQGRLKRRHTFVIYNVYYDDKEITIGEYQALTDPTYDKRWDQIEGKKGVCNLSIAPTVLYFVGAAVSVIGFSLGATPDLPREPRPSKPRPPQPKPAEAKPPEEPIVPSAILDAVAATGKFPTFLKAVDKAKVRDALATRS